MKNKFLKIRNIITAALFGTLMIAVPVSILANKKTYSMSERRNLQKIKNPNPQNIMTGQFMSQFENFGLDHFPFRDQARKIKANFSTSILLKKDNNKFYRWNGYISKLEYPINTGKLQINLNTFNQIYQNNLSNSNCSIFVSIIPDKNYFLGLVSNTLTMDYGQFTNLVRNSMSWANYIDIFPELSLDCYYFTDQHWKQECILPVAEKILSELGNPQSPDKFDFIKLDRPFYGAWHDQSSFDTPADTIYYGLNQKLSNCIVTSFSTGKPTPTCIYNLKKANGKDPYDVYLSGPDPLIEIQNPNSTSQKELVVFRDSFGSSLIPLIATCYSKVTLIDIRYLNPNFINRFINFSNQDVLFLYSTLILNN